MNPRTYPRGLSLTEKADQWKSLAFIPPIPLFVTISAPQAKIWGISPVWLSPLIRDYFGTRGVLDPDPQGG